ncbi:hypothetical protein K505DRAFT_421522 [Melanomma pulvis-pyrius CBS 109.77]|uniref:Uncharacterized protein n=1 Tax=Melanomma pulvis-pyrius CBS 109.77 TaxID=1314802 RepID=A0A6A6WUE7_9PLEO|nr:hypothetical protein K505DRAFT_421522 [Melanomma pulvis-pyrius CBS 109.77]
MGRDIPDIRQPGDILFRASRPQRSSTFVPHVRDWRYTTGVYRHEDFEDSRGDQTIWDQLDEDYINGVFGPEKRARKEKKDDKEGRKQEGGQDGDGDVDIDVSEKGAEEEDMGTAPWMSTTPSPRKEDRDAPSTTPKKGNQEKGSRAVRVGLFQPSEDTVETGERKYKQIGLIVRLKYSRQASIEVYNLLNQLPQSLSTLSRTLSAPLSPAKSASVGPRKIAAFKRRWIDETKDFNMEAAKKGLRSSGAQLEDIPPGYAWFLEAVPVDAILPPGIPLSSKEINAFYPHHARWKDVALRLFNNGYRGRDIIDIQSWFRGHESLVTGKVFDGTLRSTVKTILGTTTDEVTKPSRNLATDALDPGKFVKSRGFVVPTFDELVIGLQYLPSGLDARGLTQCIVWYLNNRDRFTPRLEFNVLHTQSLIRALRQPLKPYGSRNLDMVALQEWKEHGAYAKRKVEDEKHEHESSTLLATRKISQLEINPSKESVSMHVALPLRNIFTFPFLSMIAMAGEGLQMGVNKASNRRREREEKEQREKEKNERENREGHMTGKYRIPKLSHFAWDEQTHPPQQVEVEKPCHTPKVSWEKPRPVPMISHKARDAGTYPLEKSKEEQIGRASNLSKPVSHGVPKAAQPPEQSDVAMPDYILESAVTAETAQVEPEKILGPQLGQVKEKVKEKEKGEAAIAVRVPEIPEDALAELDQMMRETNEKNEDNEETTDGIASTQTALAKRQRLEQSASFSAPPSGPSSSNWPTNRWSPWPRTPNYAAIYGSQQVPGSYNVGPTQSFYPSYPYYTQPFYSYYTQYPYYTQPSYYVQPTHNIQSNTDTHNPVTSNLGASQDPGAPNIGAVQGGPGNRGGANVRGRARGNRGRDH